MTDRPDRFKTGLFLILSFLLLAFNLYKSATASLTHDEAYTHHYYVHASLADIVLYEPNGGVVTNNHILNTLLMKAAESILGHSELVLRLPNLLGQALYLFFVFLLIRKLDLRLFLPAAVLLTLNPYLLDFFGLARGYGLSIAFMMGSIYYLLRYLEGRHDRHIILFNLGAFLALWSNFSLLHYYAAGIATLNLLLIGEAARQGREGWSQVWRANRIILPAVLLTAAVIVRPILKILELRVVDFGGKEGFVKDTVGSLVVKTFYESPMEAVVLWGVQWGAVALVLLGVVLVVIKAWSGDTAFFERHKDVACTGLLLLFIALSSIVQHHLLGTDYTRERFALFLFPGFLLFVVYLLRYLAGVPGGRLSVALGGGLALLVLLHSLSNLSRRYYLDWKYDVDTRKVLEILAADGNGGKEAGSVQIGVDWHFEPVLNYYRNYAGVAWLKQVNRDGLHPEDDYVYLFTQDYNPETVPGVVIFRSEAAGAVLVKRQPLGAK